VKIRSMVGLLLSLLVASPVFAARTILYYENECCRNVTEGEFAIVYAQALKLHEPAQGWTVQSAAAALSAIGHQPDKGWVLSRFVSEGVMAGLLRNSPFYRKPFDTEQFQRSNLMVTVAKARSALPVEDAITQGEFAILVAQALNVPAPKGGWSSESASKALSAQPIPLSPTKGWQLNAPLKEVDMIKILAPTTFHPTSVDPNLEISPVHAYSVLFGKFEIATEGHFGVFLAKAIGAPEPAGGWSKRGALDFMKREFGVENAYGWSPDAPLCVDVFENTLRKVLLQLKSGAPSRQTNGGRALLAMPQAGDAGAVLLAGAAGTFTDFGMNEGPAQAADAAKRNKEVESFLNDLRRNGLIPTDRCATMPAQALLAAAAPLGSADPPPPASSSVPPLD